MNKYNNAKRANILSTIDYTLTNENGKSWGEKYHGIKSQHKDPTGATSKKKSGLKFTVYFLSEGDGSSLPSLRSS